jgi:hypothetical protein
MLTLPRHLGTHLLSLKFADINVDVNPDVTYDYVLGGTCTHW